MHNPDPRAPGRTRELDRIASRAGDAPNAMGRFRGVAAVVPQKTIVK